MRPLLFAVLALGLVCAANAQAQETLEGPAVAQGGFWTDWRFWQIVVTGTMAFLGFTVGIWVKDWFDRRRDDQLRAHQEADRARDSAIFAIAIRAEIKVLMGDAYFRIDLFDGLIKKGGPVPPPDFAFFDIPLKPVYASNTGRIGELKVAVRSVVTAHGRADHIRSIVAGVLAHPSETSIQAEELAILGGELRSLLVEAAEAVNDICAFLGEPAMFPDPQQQVFAQMKAEASAREAPIIQTP